MYITAYSVQDIQWSHNIYLRDHSIPCAEYADMYYTSFPKSYYN